MSEVLYLSEEDVKKTITIREALDAIEEGLKATARGEVVHPPKIYMNVKEKPVSFIKPMAAYVKGQYPVVKIFTFFPENPIKHNLPTSSIIITLHDPETGVPVAILAGKHITNVRTAATAAIAAKYLAKKTSKTVALIGAGPINEHVAYCLNEIFKIEEFRVVGKTKERRAEPLARKLKQKYNVETKAYSSEEIKTAISGADIVSIATTANKPLVKKEWLEPGMFIAKIGSFQELDPDIIKSADKVVVDWWEYVSTRVPEIRTLVEKGELSKEKIHAELHEVVAGLKSGRESDSEKNVFITIGIGVADSAVANIVYKRALERKYGITLKLL